jgi:hypothetical protein
MFIFKKYFLIIIEKNNDNVGCEMMIIIKKIKKVK